MEDILRNLNVKENNVIDNVPSDAALVEEVIKNMNGEKYVDESYINYLLLGQQLTNQDMNIDEKRVFVENAVRKVISEYSENDKERL